MTTAWVRKISWKWVVALLVLAVLLGLGVRKALVTRQAAQDALRVQEAAQKAQATVLLAAGDTLRLQMQELVQTLPISGAVKAVSSAFVKARVAGELQDLVVREGDTVTAGQVIARVDATEYQARLRQARLQAEAAKAQMDIANRTLENNKALVNQGFISQTALDASLSTLAANTATYKAAQAGADVAQKAVDDAVLRAPISGQVAQRLAQPGERVGIDARVVEIVDLSRLELEASLGAADALALRTGQSATLTVEGSAQTLTAKVVRINPSATAGSRAVLVYLALDANTGVASLRQGLFAQGSLATGSTRVLALPEDCVRSDKPLPYVQLVVGDQVVHQNVTTGVRGQVGGQQMVEVGGVADGALVLRGTVGGLRAGTLVKLAEGTR